MAEVQPVFDKNCVGCHDQADLLMKPFGIPELLGKVREILDR